MAKSFLSISLSYRYDQSVLKVVYLAIQKASQKWNMALHDWRAAMNRFSIEFEGRFSYNKALTQKDLQAREKEKKRFL